MLKMSSKVSRKSQWIADEILTFPSLLFWQHLYCAAIYLRSWRADDKISPKSKHWKPTKSCINSALKTLLLHSIDTYISEAILRFKIYEVFSDRSVKIYLECVFLLILVSFWGPVGVIVQLNSRIWRMWPLQPIKICQRGHFNETCL